MQTGADLFRYVNGKMVGRIAMRPAEGAFLVDAVRALPQKSLYVEIGTLWGGAALLAALARDDVRVLTVDRMDTDFWRRGDPGVGHKRPTPEIVLKNFARFKVADRVSIHLGLSWPWPYPKLRPYLFLVDGDHSYEGCLHDLLTAASLKAPTVLVHDYRTGRHPGIEQALDEFLSNSAYRLAGCVETLAKLVLVREEAHDEYGRKDCGWFGLP